MIMSCGFALKRILITFIIFLPWIIGNPANAVCLQSGFSSLSGGNWLYVGGSGPGNYSTIEAALENASNGDTIFVYHGIYNESVTIRKSIILIGEDKQSTILKSTVDCVVIKAMNVTVNGFSLQQIGQQEYWGIDLQGPYNITISEIDITGFATGFFSQWCKNILINNVTFFNNGCGADIDFARNYTFSHCLFKENNFGINHKGSHGYGDASVLIKGCNFSNNICGINMNELCTESKCPTTIEENTFFQNEYGIVTFDSQGVEIHQNNFIGNTKHVDLYRESQIILIPIYMQCRQHWSGNYWENWNSGLPYPLRGTWVLFVWPGLFYQFLHFPFIEFDKKPATTPNVLN